MSLYGMMRTGVAGMNAQASRLGTVADNIANSGTTGYKRARAEFSSLVMPQTGGSYVSGGVNATTQRSVTTTGIIQPTTSATDLAIDGNGMFIVQDASGSIFMTRAGNFVPDGNGRLVNAAGFQLLGYSTANGEPTVTANGFEGLEPVTVSSTGLRATPTTAGLFAANLPAGATDVAAGSLPSDNVAGSTYTAKSSIVVVDDLGGQKLLDLYFTKTGANSWEVTAFDRSTASASGGFPYSAGPVGTQTLSFDGTTGQLTGANDSMTIAIPGGQSMDLDLSGMTQLDSPYELFDVGANGNPPSALESVEISGDGTVYGLYDDGSYRSLYRIPLATVTSPDMMTSLPGNVFSASAESGAVRIGFANESGFGSVVSSALENSNVDIATELTNMIESQRSYTANSKVFQTGSELMDVLVNLKR